MGLDRYPTEGGSAGARGHSNMEHWDDTAAIKASTRSRRRAEDRTTVDEAIKHDVQLGSIIDAAHTAQIEERLSGWTTMNPDLQALIDEVPLADKLSEARRMLRSDDADERILAVRMIREPIGPAPEALAIILDALEREAEVEVMEWLVSGLTFRADPAALTTALLYAEHDAAEVRDAAAAAIAACSVTSDRLPTAVQALRRLASDPDEEVRFSALWELGALWQDGVWDPEVRPLLEDAVMSEDPRLRQIAEESLGYRS